MKIRIDSIRNMLVCAGFVLAFFSSACLWNEEQLKNYIACSFAVIIITILAYLVHPILPNKIINNRYIWWIVVNYSIFEIYGTFFLRAGEFNWDYILVSAVLQICLTILLMSFDTLDEVIKYFCISCLISAAIVSVYFISSSEISISNISFGSSFGTNMSGNRNTVAINIGVMLMPISYYALKYKWKNLLLNIAVIVSGVCMLLTGSKKSFIVVAMIVLMIFLADRGSIKYLVLPLIIVFGLYAVFNIPFLYNTVGFRVKDMLATFGIGASVTAAQSTAIRSSLIKMGAESMWNHPILGGGMYYFQYINKTPYYAHNNYIELLNDVGIVGTMIFYIPHINNFKKITRKVGMESDYNKKTLLIFLAMYVLLKLLLDFASVSFSGMCIEYIEFLVVAEAMRRGVTSYE